MKRLLSVALLAAMLTACAGYPFRVPVRQGNYVSQDALKQLTVGMTREQVRALMGSPLLVDAFHADRWDYAYLYSPGTALASIRRQVTVYFTDNKVSRVEPGQMDADPADIPAAQVPHVLDIDSLPVQP